MVINCRCLFFLDFPITRFLDYPNFSNLQFFNFSILKSLNFRIYLVSENLIERPKSCVVVG